MPEKCDGLDNDCDGVRDQIAEPCYTHPNGCFVSASGSHDCIGECRWGIRVCAAHENSGIWTGTWGTCQQETGPTTEICDGRDNDCDGTADNNAQCPNASKCVDGSCVRTCQKDNDCPLGAITFGTCVNGICQQHGDPDPCQHVVCKTDWKCIAGQCYDPCASCKSGWICKSGSCVDPCSSILCSTFQKCIAGACVSVCEFGTCVSDAGPPAPDRTGCSCRISVRDPPSLLVMLSILLLFVRIAARRSQS